MAGAQVVVDVSNSPSFEDRAAMDFFQTAGRNITAAEVAAGVRHHVALSVVGTDRLQDSGYFRAKLAQEQLIRTSPVPYTLVHATQFFDFIRTIAQLSTDGGVVRLPPVQFQPMAADDVAGAIVDVALADPVNDLIEIAGPETFTLDEAVRRVLAHDGDPRKVIADPAAPYYGVTVSDRTLVPDVGARLGATSRRRGARRRTRPLAKPEAEAWHPGRSSCKRPFRRPPTIGRFPASAAWARSFASSAMRAAVRSTT